MYIYRKAQFFLMIITLTVSSMGAVQAASLTTTYANNNGQSGAMFDITALSNVIITGFDHHLSGIAGTSVDMEIYGKTGTHVGSEGIPGNWTLLGATTVISAGLGVGTTIPLSLNIPISTGSTHAFYVTATSTNGGTAYTNGTAVGSVFVADAAIQILEGTALNYPYGTTYIPRVWNGTVHYGLGMINIQHDIPTLSEWALMLLVLSLGLFGFYSTKNRYK